MKPSEAHTWLFVVALLLLILALFWLICFLMARFVRKGDLWGGALLDPKTHEESRELNLRREQRLKTFWPSALICFAVSVALFVAAGIVR